MQSLKRADGSSAIDEIFRESNGSSAIDQRREQMGAVLLDEIFEESR